MSMSKKDFIALADDAREYFKHRAFVGESGTSCMDTSAVVELLVGFCRKQNPQFKEDRWRDYLAGKCGPNGGKKAP